MLAAVSTALRAAASHDSSLTPIIDNVLGAEQGCDFDFLRADGIEHADYGPLYARMGHS